MGMIDLTLLEFNATITLCAVYSADYYYVIGRLRFALTILLVPTYSWWLHHVYMCSYIHSSPDNPQHMQCIQNVLKFQC